MRIFKSTKPVLLELATDARVVTARVDTIALGINIAKPVACERDGGPRAAYAWRSPTPGISIIPPPSGPFGSAEYEFFQVEIGAS